MDRFYNNIEDIPELNAEERNYNLAIKIFGDNPNELSGINKTLKKYGCPSFRFLSHGNEAIALETNDNRVIRISGSTREQRLKHPAILQPYYHFKTEHLTIEVLPLVQVGATEQDRARLKTLFKKSGFEPHWDFDTPSNIGYLSDNTPIVVDPGSIVPDKSGTINDDIKQIFHEWYAVENGQPRWKQHMLYQNTEQPDARINNPHITTMPTPAVTSVTNK